MADILIHNVDIIEESKVLKDGYIEITNGFITKVGKKEDLDTLSSKEIIDGKGKLVAPGLVNTHTHVSMGLLRNYADDLELMEWLQTAIWPAEEKLTGHLAYWGAVLGIAEMFRSGTTCFSDMYFFMDHVAKAVQDTGIRAVLARGMAGVAPTAERALVESKELFEQFHNYNDGQIKVMLGPHAPYTCPDAYLEKVIALGKDLGAEIHMHLSETKFEVDTVIKETGKTPIAHMNDLGLFDLGCVAAHCVHVTEEDMQIMAEKGVRVAHNPQSNLKLASGIAPLPEMMAKGITVGLGTDGSASNNNADMLEEVRLAATLHKARLYDPKAVPAHVAWSLGTVEGAKVLGYKDVGTIAVGNKADLVLYDVSGLHWQPRYNDVASLVYAANSSDAATVIVNGQVVMKDRELLTIDEEQLLYEVEKGRKIFLGL